MSQPALDFFLHCLPCPQSGNTENYPNNWAVKFKQNQKILLVMDSYTLI